MNQETQRNAITTIVKTTNSCNMNCDYCYANSGKGNGTMNFNTLENIITKISAYNGKGQKTSLLWHGGEPLIAGKSFFNKIIEFQYELKIQGYEFENEIQSNGTLIDEYYADFFKKNNFSVGLSIDGPSEINSKTRKYFDGSNTYSDIMKSISILRERGIEANVIVTLSQANIHDVKKIYDFLKENGLNARFNPLVKSGRAINKYSLLSISPSEYFHAKKELLDIWINDENPIRLFCIEDTFKNILTKNVIKECTFSKNCQQDFIGISHIGDVYPCAEFDGEIEFRYGNINTDSLDDILSNPLRLKLINRNKFMKGCIECHHSDICNGGCMRNAYAYSGDIFGKDPYCNAYSSLFDVVSKVIINNCKEVN